MAISVGVVLQAVVEAPCSVLGVRPGEDHHVATAIAVAVDLLDPPFLGPGVGMVEDVQLSHGADVGPGGGICTDCGPDGDRQLPGVI